MMKKIILIAICFFGAQLQAQEVLFTVGNQTVTAEEFKAVYEKNKGVGNAIDPKTPEEYLDLYVRFKLKIAEAFDQQRDTAAKFVKEFGGYRAQLAKPYLSDAGSEDALIKEAYSRMSQEVRAAHIMFELASSALPSDTLRVYKAMMELRDEIESGKLSFEDAARSKSADTWSAKQGGDLGYFTAFNMVYPFESGAYDQEIGSISKPIRSQFGYHLIKTTDKRPASGTVRVRQIFFAAGEKAKLAEKQRAERSAQEIYTRLQNGEEFGALVSFSEDRKTKDRGGEMPEFGLNKMMPSFENAAFALEEPGDFSAPIQTNIGWHVIQLIEKKPLPEFESLKKEIKSKVKRDSRSQVGAKKFVNTLKRNYNFTVNERNYRRTVALVDAAKFATGQWEAPSIKTDRVVATYADAELRQSTVLAFWAKNQKPQTTEGVEEYLRLLFNVVSNDNIIAYEDSQLESKYPDFRNLVREYREGILLFDLTQEEVWDKAAKDSVGIYIHYQTIKNNFTWDDRISYKLWVAQNEKDAKRIARWVTKGKTDKLNEFLTSNDALAVAVSEGTAQQKDEEVFQMLWNTSPGVHGPIAFNEGFAVLQTIDYLPAGPKALNEVKGLVIASYQNELEEKWVATLQDKFEVSINESVKEKLFAELAD
jgi:peptidyl-prolyl cis-trans isomerase SurA